MGILYAGFLNTLVRKKQSYKTNVCARKYRTAVLTTVDNAEVLKYCFCCGYHLLPQGALKAVLTRRACSYQEENSRKSNLIVKPFAADFMKSFPMNTTTMCWCSSCCSRLRIENKDQVRTSYNCNNRLLLRSFPMLSRPLA